MEMEMMLDKKQIQVIFLFEFKMGCKAVETTRNIKNAFGSNECICTNECTVQWWFKKFRKGDESLEDKERSGWPLEVDSDNWEPSLKLILLTTTQEVPKELSVNSVLWSFGIWSILERWKQNLYKWVPR